MPEDLPSRAAGRTLSPRQARTVYDRLGSLLDTQRFYENAALDALIEHGAFGRAWAIFELGCGTGRLAEGLLSRVVGADCRYVGTDISPTMIRLATRRLRRWAPRAVLRISDGSMRFPEPSGSFDRFVSTYVVDLLADADIAAMVTEAHRLLGPGGRLCVVNLAEGGGPPLTDRVADVEAREPGLPGDPRWLPAAPLPRLRLGRPLDDRALPDDLGIRRIIRDHRRDEAHIRSFRSALTSHRFIG